MKSVLPDKLMLVHTALSAQEIPHGFGGAIALAFYGEPRDTRDIDINIALPPHEHARVLDALAARFPIPDRPSREAELERIAQTRLFWEQTGIDLFMADIPFHDSIAQRTHEVDYVGTRLPIISAEDLIVLKAAFNRPKDWIDIATIIQVQQRLDEAYLREWLGAFSEPDDERLGRLERLLREAQRESGPEQQG